MKTTFLKKILFLLILTFTQLGYSQLSKIHYIPPLTAASQGNANPEDQYFYISTPSEQDVAFTINHIGLSEDKHYVVSKSSPQEIFINTGNAQLFVSPISTSQVIDQRGFIIEAVEPIYVSVRMEAGGAQAGALVSKGSSALGTEFRVGAYTNQNPSDNYLSFVSVMASEDNTIVTFSDVSNDTEIVNNTKQFPYSETLNKGESYTIAMNSESTAHPDNNKDGLIGALIKSDKPIAVNTGSTNGSFHNGGGRDYGIDQIVGLDKIGKEYIFVRGFGNDEWENALIVAHFDNTEIYINGNSTAIETINAGEYYVIEGNMFNSSGNMYVKTSADVFAYQGVGGLANNGSPNEANQGMFFVPPLSCETRGNIDNIANIDKIGSTIYNGGLSIVTKKGAVFTINELPTSSFSTQGPFPVSGNNLYETYKVIGLSGNISVECNDELYCAYFNYNGSATSGGYYSGFPSNPEINFGFTHQIKGICLENGLELSVANTDSFDSFEWYYNDGTGYVTTNNTGEVYIPTKPGTYQLWATLDCTGNTFKSVGIPISHCPDDTDNDGIIDDIDIDNDNDGILNCTESDGDNTIPLLNPKSGSLAKGSYTFNGSIVSTGSTTNSIIGNLDGNFKSDVLAKNGLAESSVTYTLNFNKELNLLLKLPSSTSLGDGNLDDNQEFIIQVSNDKTITLLDPDDQLLVDTNYDGVYEPGITQFSSFQIRFKINSSSLSPSDSKFEFVSNMTNYFSYTHINISETNNNTAIFEIKATCLPLDSDNDGINDEFDYDNDNDGIPDVIENTGINKVFDTTDANNDGLFDIFETTSTLIDSDNDTVLDFYDLDSDNDGIYDLYESGSGLLDTNFDGVIDNVNATIGINGWDDNAETSPDSGTIGYNLNDSDNDLKFNYLDLDSDGDICFDVIEAGYTSTDNNGTIDGTVNIETGLITDSDGYATTPHENYLISAPFNIINQPTAISTCELSSTVFEIEVESNSSTIVTYQWEVSVDNGSSWSSISDDVYYLNSITNQLTILNTPLSLNSNLYRVQLEANGNTCGDTSEQVVLEVNQLPIIAPNVNLIQCDDDGNDIGFSVFNLSEANDKISTNASSNKFTYYLSKEDAINKVDSILDPTSFKNRIKNSDIVWASVQSEFNCSSVSEIELIVTPSKIPLIVNNSFFQCDDFLDENGNDNANNNKRDGISSFDFSSADIELKSKLPVGQPISVQYYRDEADALSEKNPIIDVSNYRNIGYKHEQKIYARLDNELNNDCLGLSGIITLTVEKLPIAYNVTLDRQCDDDQDGFFNFDTSNLEIDLLKDQELANVSISYFDAFGNILKDNNGTLINSPFPNEFITQSQIITAKITNNTTLACFDETTIEFIVDKLPIANPVVITSVCDDESNDGEYEFDTSTIQSTILGDQKGMIVKYFDTSNNELPSPLPNPFKTQSQTINVQVTNSLNNSCIATTSIEFKINQLPNFDVESERILCLTDPPSNVLLEVYPDNKKESYSYLWIDPNGNSFNTETLQATVKGTYKVTLSKTDGTNCSRTKEIVVTESERPKIDSNDIIVKDDSKNNTITIITDNLGIGDDYRFSLDTGFSFDTTTSFNYVEAGIHTVFIKDMNSCGITSIDVSVLSFPKFFTPNNDGDHDSWNIIGISPNFYPKVTATIFDRYGKLIKSFNPYQESWDGLYNGTLLPSTDYWYIVELTDINNKKRIKKSHFSLIR